MNQEHLLIGFAFLWALAAIDLAIAQQEVAIETANHRNTDSH